jgi:hypothetical protein
VGINSHATEKVQLAIGSCSFSFSRQPSGENEPKEKALFQRCFLKIFGKNLQKPAIKAIRQLADQGFKNSSRFHGLH